MNSDISIPLPDGADQKNTRTDEAHTGVPKLRSFDKLRTWWMVNNPFGGSGANEHNVAPDQLVGSVNPDSATGRHTEVTLVGPETEKDSRYRKAPRRTFKPSIEELPRK